MKFTKDSREENVTPQKVQAEKDPFRYAWFFSIPETTPNRAIFEYYRYENRWSPYKWNGLALNPRFPQNTISELFNQIDQSCPPHPVPSYKRQLRCYTWGFHLPAILVVTLIYLYLLKTQEKYTQTIIWTYVAFILALVISIIAIEARGKLGYYSAMDKRVISLKSLLTDLNNSRYISRGFRFDVGEEGAWIELRFEDQSLEMIRIGGGIGQGVLTSPGGFGSVGGGSLNNMAKPLGQNHVGEDYNPF